MRWASWARSLGARITGVAGRTVLVTGGGSGIGRALAHRLSVDGAHVVIADIDGTTIKDIDGAATIAGGTIHGVELDVRDRTAVANEVSRIVERHGRLDLLFNNAGISVGGPTDDMPGEYWDRIIDINLGGVVNGILAAYPVMVAQGSGHIVNTASAAGLVAAPFTAAYSATKHAVVGLGAALRPEAALHGVRITTLCPGMVETPILDRPPPDDLPPPASRTLTAREYLSAMGISPISADAFARRAVDGVSRNRAIVITPASARIGWYLHRLSPTATDGIGRTTARRVTRQMRSTAAHAASR